MRLVEKKGTQDETNNLTMALYKRATKRNNKMAGIIGMLRANLATLVLYNEVTPDGKNRAKAALADFDKEWEALMNLTDADHETE